MYTYITFERFLTVVLAFVYLNLTLGAKGFAAKFAQMRQFTGVYCLMSFQ